ncbi:hypothetical protein AB0K15_43255 [Amycolatopsis sp. NPDC049253]|uniref:hypothetical protein n=1 Tax=Amycolatopsis sp. NPDC049253 TaxID=3155274 RepID=UPI003421E07F
MAIPFPGTAAPGGQLDHHLAEGYDVERAAEGWVLLRRGSARVAVTVRTEERGSCSAWAGTSRPIAHDGR